ncbi:MAG: hypothetical protein KBD31_04725, partial [Proteobacteria bacterium]|nr:hypothetical protein [Pseudomonadota bacterium]
MIKFLISIIMSSFPALLNACCCGSDDDVAIRHHPPLHQQMRSMAAVPQPGYGTPPLPQHQPVSSIKEKRFEDRAVTGIVLDSLNSLESQNAKYTKENVIKTFYHYQTPEGMLPKLMELQNYYLNFIIDDSGSMAANSYWQDAEGRRITTSRWEEVKYRLQIFFHHLACVPIQYIQISFLNRPDLMKFNPQQYGSMREFINAAQQQIEQIFRQGPNGFTPIYDTLCNAFQQQGRWYHYLFTDGEPTDRNGNDYGQAEAVARIITQRSAPENHLFT